MAFLLWKWVRRSWDSRKRSKEIKHKSRLLVSDSKRWPSGNLVDGSPLALCNSLRLMFAQLQSNTGIVAKLGVPAQRKSRILHRIIFVFECDHRPDFSFFDWSDMKASKLLYNYRKCKGKWKLESGSFLLKMGQKKLRFPTKVNA